MNAFKHMTRFTGMNQINLKHVSGSYFTSKITYFAKLSLF